MTGANEPDLDREALRLAAALLCPGEDPELRCDACRRVRARLHPDLFFVEPEGVQIRVDRVREALAFAAGRPYEAPRRVAVVPRCELLGAEAGNALLKSLGEPGARFHWILTATRPESLLPTIRSRCAVARVPPADAAERLAAWRARGFSDEDASDLSILEREAAESTPESLAEFRHWRQEFLEALEEGLAGNLPSLLAAAEEVARAEKNRGHMLAELLADAAAIGAVSQELLRHRAVAGALQKIGLAAPRAALERAALKAADPPPDNRRGNRRLHFESLLLELYLSRTASGGP